MNDLLILTIGIAALVILLNVKMLSLSDRVKKLEEWRKNNGLFF